MTRFALVPFALLPAALLAAPPETPKKPVESAHHGVTYTDAYGWIEDGQNPDAKNWIAAQNAHAKGYVKTIPDRDALARRIRALFGGEPPSFDRVQFANGVMCARVDGSDLVVLKSENDPKPLRVLVEADKPLFGEKGNVDHYALSENGRYAAVCVSADGIEEGTIYVYETATGKRLPGALPQASAAPGGDIAWTPDSTGFYYTKYPDATANGKTGRDRYARAEVWFHKLGTKPGADRYVCGRDLPAYTSLFLSVSRAGRVLVRTQTGFGSDEYACYELNGDKLKLLYAPEECATAVGIADDGSTYIESWKGAPNGALLRVPPGAADPANPAARAKPYAVVPECPGVLAGWLVTDHFAFAVHRADGSERLRVFGLSGREHAEIPVPPFCAVEELTHLRGNTILYRVTGHLSAPEWYRYDPATHKPEKVALSETSLVSFRDAEVVREFAPAKDGTKIPLTIIRKKNCTLDGDRPVLLTGYGSARSIERPAYQLQPRLWLDRGGVWAVAHPRGEAEFGDAWHRAARGPKKGTTGDDFVACAEHLIARKYTKPTRLAIRGGSDGGLLMGMALTKRPDLFASAVIDCGVLDVMRMDKDHYGPHCITEYGKLDSAANARAALAFSPLQNVKPKTEYPAVWIRVGDNDRRVDPIHSWKMAAALQATGTKKPVLLTTVENEGHDFYVPLADEVAFQFTQLGVRFGKGK
jgi:prolyl oligopeptidase